MKKLLFILLCLPIAGLAQTLNLRLIQAPAGSSPTLTASVSTLSGFSTTVGTASGSQNFTVQGSNLVASCVVTPPTGYEVSGNNSTFQSSLTITQSGGALAGQPVTVYVRITSGASVGTPTGTLTLVAGTATKNVSLSGNVNALTPTLTTSVSTLSGFTTTAGTASSSQNFTVSGSALTAGVTVTAPSNWETSTDNVTFSASAINLSQSGGNIVSQPVTIYARIAASATAGTLTGTNITVASSGATTKNVAVSGTVTSASSNVARFNLSNTAQSVPGWTNLFGSAAPFNLSATDPNTGFTLQTIGTNWNPYGGFLYSSNSDGANTGTFTLEFPSTVVAGNFYNSNTPAIFTGSNYGFQMPSMPAGNYTVQIIGSIKSSVNSGITTPEYHVKFGTGSDQISDATHQPMNNQNNAGTFITFTGTITAGQTIYISLNVPSSLSPGAGCINAIIVTKN